MGPGFVIGFTNRDSGRDTDAVTAIDRACFTDGTVNVVAELERPWSKVWVARAEESSEPRAFLIAWLVADELHVLSLGTLPAFRRQGMGSALLRHALGFARENGVRLVLLEVRRSNEVAIALYRSLGFSATAVRPHYYADNAEDAVEMSLELDPATGAIQPGTDGVSI